VPHFTNNLKAARKPINARAETVASSGMFRGAFAQRRCLVPAAVFYEWRAMAGGKQPYAITRADGQPLAFAGLMRANLARITVLLICDFHPLSHMLRSLQRCQIRPVQFSAISLSLASVSSPFQGLAEDAYKGRPPTARAKAADVLRFAAEGVTRQEIATRILASAPTAAA
jgi:SOS response associated peptidase (SRAP)